MRGSKWRCVAWVLVIVVVLVAIGLAVLYSGVYNIAATYPDRGPVRWALGTAMDHSVARHAAGIRVPPLDDPAMVRLGFQHYREMCVECHGAPGVPAAELARGLNPDPPELVESAGDWKPEELFWITKNGVRMTGMPAWGATHTDEQIWAVVAFMRGLPKLTPEAYKALDRQVPPLSGD
jgi:mono/diheme cytochrome c family protein